MSIAKKCDRCGHMYEQYNKEYESNEKMMNGFATVCVSKAGDNYIICEIYDLCESCKDSLKNWYHEGKITLSNQQVEEFEKEERMDTVMDEPDKLIIQEPESDGDRYGEHKMG